MIDRHVRHDRDAAVDDVRRVPRSTHADLDDRDVDGLVGEPAERGRGDDVEVRRVDADRLLDERHRVEHLLERVVVDRLTVDRHPFVDPFEMRARVRADLQPERGEQLGEHAHGGGLAVRARDVDGREFDLGRAEVLHQRGDPLERGRAPPAPGGDVEALQVDVRAQPARPVEAGGRAHASGSASSTRTENAAPTSTSSLAILPASHTSWRARLRARRGGARCRPRTTRATGAASETLACRLRLAHLGEHRRPRLRTRAGRRRRARSSARVGPRRAVDRAVAPPRPHFFADVREHRREQPEQGRQRDAQRDRGRTHRRVVGVAVRAALDELDVVVAERPEEAVRCARASARSRTIRTRRSRRRRDPRASAAANGRSRSRPRARPRPRRRTPRARTSTR